MKKISALILTIVFACQDLRAPQQLPKKETQEALFTPKECCILAFWMLAGTATMSYNTFFKQEKPEAPTPKKLR